jgi:UDP-glucose 4-epimerase
MNAPSYDRVLVTGGAGFIGSHTVDLLLESGTSVWVLDNLSSGRMSNLTRWKGERKLHFSRTAITNPKAVNESVRKVEAVIHLAAAVSPFISVRRPDVTNEINVTGTINILRAASASKVDKVVFASSSSVYGNSEFAKIPEHAPNNPITPYGVSKLAGEKYCSAFYRTYGLRTVALRYFNVYGERQQDNPYSGVIAIFANKLRKGLRSTIFGDGRQTRDFIHVSDVARANLLALRSIKGIGGAFNIGTGKKTSIKELYSMIAQTLGKGIKPLTAPERAGDIRNSCANTHAAKQYLEFKSRVKLHWGLERLLEYLQHGHV